MNIMTLSKVVLVIAVLSFDALSLASEQWDFLKIPNLSKTWKVVTFDDIPPTKYQLQDSQLQIEVEKSNSFILYPFTEVKKLRGATIAWKLVGTPIETTKGKEEEKSGDDFPLRIGLLINGAKSSIPFFAPSWVKLIRDNMHFGVSHIEYFVLGSKHQPNDKWFSPFSDDFRMTAVDSGKEQDGFLHAKIDFPKNLEVVGLWIMSDGDNTKSNFKVIVNQLEFTL